MILLLGCWVLNITIVGKQQYDLNAAACVPNGCVMQLSICQVIKAFTLCHTLYVSICFALLQSRGTIMSCSKCSHHNLVAVAESNEGLTFDEVLTKYVGEFGKGQVRRSIHSAQSVQCRIAPAVAM
jgi:hypothetical protein